MFDLIVSQGRVADRAERMIEGAATTAEALSGRYGAIMRIVGEPEEPAEDDWSVSLPLAKDTLAELQHRVAESVADGGRTFMVASTCPASLASLPVVAREHPDAVVLWVDAHGDYNTPDTTQSGYLGGMVLAAGCGLWNSGHGGGIRPEQVVLLGARDIDPLEYDILRNTGVRVISPAEATPEYVLRAINGAPVWVHVDWDVLEPGYVPAEFSVPNGVLPTSLRSIFEALPSHQIRGVELAEFQAPVDEAERDAALAILLDTVAPLFEDLSTTE